MKTNRSIFLYFVIILSILFTQTATPALAQDDSSPNTLDSVTWYVSTTGNDVNDCLTTSTPCATINGAINKSANGDTIQVAGGTYTGTGTEVVLINKSITLSGGWDAGFTAQSETSIIDGQGARRGITISSGTVVIDNFTVQNGFHSSQGGGIRNQGTLTLNSSVISNNISEWMGGGIYNFGTLEINNTLISGNIAGNICCTGGGGGAGIKNSVAVIMNNSAITNNQILGGFSGSGIDNSGTFTINNSSISNNRGAFEGIHFFSSTGIMTINNSTIYSNGNRGISIYRGQLLLNNSTVSGSPRGIYQQSGDVTLQNSIVAGNSQYDCIGTIVSGGYNIIGNITSACSFTPMTGDLVNVSPLLGTFTGSPGYLPLLLGSPAIDAGNPATCLADDQLGVTRPQGSACDIGAYEYSPVIISGNAGVAGAKLSFMENDVLKTATTDENGDYTFIVSARWSGTVTPSKVGWSFTPDSIDYNDVQADQENQDYTATRTAYVISGNTNMARVTLTYEDNGTKSVLSNSNGSYKIPVSFGWSGTITPFKAGNKFLPTHRVYTDVNEDISEQGYAPAISSIVVPKGATTDQTPTYRWKKIMNATKYQYQLFQGNKLIYTKTVLSNVCGPKNCSNTPTTQLTDGSYKWRVRAMVDDVWQPYTPYKVFKLGLKVGYWSGSYNEFYVMPNQISVDDFAIYVKVSGCGIYKITHLPFIKIANKQFSFNKDGFYASGTFDNTRVTASGTLGLASYHIPGCGYVSGGPYPWTAKWTNIDSSIITAQAFESLSIPPSRFGENPEFPLFTVDPVEK